MIPIFLNQDIPDLTRAAKNGAVYVRRENVTAEIESLRKMDEKELMLRISVRQEEEPNSLKSETLVHLFRSIRRTSDKTAVAFPHLEDPIADTLSQRIARIIGRYRQEFREDPNGQEDFQDFQMGVIGVFCKKACTDDDSADYAEVSFGQFIVGLAQNEIKKFRRERVLNNLHDGIENYMELESGRPIALYSRDILPSLYRGTSFEQRADLIRRAMETLEEPIRTAWVLKNAEDWQIESREENVPTLARLFNKSGRTIRNWLFEADQKLAGWRTSAE